MILVVTMTVRRDKRDQFHSFEQQAARVMSRHGGKIERTVVIDLKDNPEFFKEVHLVSFPDQTAFNAYRNDEEMHAYASLRQEAVVATELLVGEEGPNYAYPPRHDP